MLKTLKHSCLCLCIALITMSCTNDTCTEKTREKEEIQNAYSQKQLLILSHCTPYKDAFCKQLTNRLKASYSITLDDVSNILNYNFALYSNIVIIETPQPQQLTETQKYMQDYVGINNIILVAVSTTIVPSMNGLDIIQAPPVTENIPDKIWETTNIIRAEIRGFKRSVY